MAQSYSVKRAGKAPISTHRAFPVIVALWFACLLGFGSLVLPAALFENLAATTGIAAIVPAAAPPLGLTARVVIALTGALVGAAAGMLLARQVARSHAPKPASHELHQGDARRRRPIAAHDELGEEGLGWAEPESAGRVRRSLIAGEGDHRSEYEAEALIEAATENSVIPAETEEQTSQEDWPMEHVRPNHAVPQIVDDEADGFAEHVADRSGLDGPTAEPEDLAPNGGEASAPQLSVVESSCVDVTVRQPLDGPLDELGLVQLAGRLGAAIEHRRTLKARRSPAASARRSPGAPAGFEAAEAEEAARAMADFFGPREAEHNPDVSEREHPYRAAPAAMRTLQIEEDYEEDDDLMAGSFSLPRRGLASAHGLSAGEPVDEEEGTDEGESDQGEYSSLLTMKNPFSRHEEFVRMDDPEMDVADLEPVAIFPAASAANPFETPAAHPWEAAPVEQSWPAELRENSTDSAAPAAAQGMARDPAEAEEHLRSALATLQRMNGAA